MSDWQADLRTRDERIARRIAELRDAQAAWIAARQDAWTMAQRWNRAGYDAMRWERLSVPSPELWFDNDGR